MVAPAPGPDERPQGDQGELRVGSYQLVRRIGSGGMGEVWLGRHVLSGGLAAVKRLTAEAAHRAHLRAYFGHEGRAVARLQHAHIVQLFEVGEDYLVTSFIDGPNLARRLQTPIDPAVAVRIVRQIADALAHAHARGVVHRDVKPANILIDPQGNAFLADFGVAAILDDGGTAADADHDRDDDDRSRRRVVGTPQFMAPEQRRGEAVGPAADQYALGRTLLEMLAGGRVPVDAEAALAELPAALPAALRDAIARATAATPAARFASVAAFADALSPGAADLSACAPPVRLAPTVRDTAAFAWCAGAHRVTAVGAEVSRADYRLAELASAGLAHGETVRAFLVSRGLADLGFSVWGQTGRLGSITEPSAYGRAADIVVLLHGWAQTRDVWGRVAEALVRDNAQALVIALDVHGFGDTRFAEMPAPELASLGAIAETAHGWRALLGLDVVPTVLVGHSMSAISLLGCDDRQLGHNVSRVALNPVLVSHDPRLRRLFLTTSWMSRTLGHIRPLRRLCLKAYARWAPATRDVAPELNAEAVVESMRMPPAIMGRLLAAFVDRPPVLTRQRRLSIVLCVDDPMIDRAAFDRAADEIGLRPEHILTLASGGHMPHLEDARHPEWTARNVAEIVHQIDSMMLTAREATYVTSETVTRSTVISGSAATR